MDSGGKGTASGSHGHFISAKSVYDAQKKGSNQQKSKIKKKKAKQPSMTVKQLSYSAKLKSKSKFLIGPKKNLNLLSKPSDESNSNPENSNGKSFPKINSSRVQSFLKTSKSLLLHHNQTSEVPTHENPAASNQEEHTDCVDDITDNSSNDNLSDDSILVKTPYDLSNNQLPKTDCNYSTSTDTLPVYETLDHLDFQIKEDSKALLFIPFNTCFYIKGRLSVTVLSGSIEMLGYVMEQDPEKSYDLYSPRGYSLNCIRSLDKKSNICKSKTINYIALKTGWVGNEELLQNKASSNSIILLSSLNTSLVQYTSRLFPVNIFKREECTPSSLTGEIRNQFVTLGVMLDSSILLRGAIFSARFYQQPDVWYDYSTQLIKKAQQNEAVRLMLLGGKGVGKSTLLRYLVNQMLQTFGSVLVIDFDPGQPEFFPAGCVSAFLVTGPILGPNFTHFQQPLFCYHVGEVDITSCPDRYIRCCHQLLNDCKMKPALSKTPTIINTMGFTSGMGLDLTLDLIRLTEPLQVLQISSRSPRRNFASTMDYEYVLQQTRGWLTSNEEFADRLTPYTLQVIYSASEFSEKCLEEWGFRPRELREIGFISYFSTLSNSLEWTLSDAVPYRISWQALAICVSHESITPNDTMAAINASLVALCILDTEAASSVSRFQAKNGQYPIILKELPIVPCVGYGLVRNIDMKNGFIYLITPEPIERLQQVNFLVKSGVHIPDCMLLDPPVSLQMQRGKSNSVCNQVHVPYATCGPSASQPACRPFRKYNPLFTLRNHV